MKPKDKKNLDLEQEEQDLQAAMAKAKPIESKPLEANPTVSKETAAEPAPILPETTPSSESQPSIQEGAVEVSETPKKQAEEDEGFLEETIESLKKKLKGSKKKPSKIPAIKDAMTVKIEKIMEHDLSDAYSELTPLQQQEFKIKGEETAWEIRKLLKSAHVKLKTIFKLILEWLKMLPGINRFFLEQEAKIKTDKIIALKDRPKD